MNIRLDVNLPDNLDVSPERLKLDLAIGLYVDDQVSLGKAAEIAGRGVLDFQRELTRREIALRYDAEEFESDLKTLQSLNRL